MTFPLTPSRFRTLISRLGAPLCCLLLAAGLAGCSGSGATVSAEEENQLRPGASVQGMLGATDLTRESGSYYDSYSFSGRANERITVSLESDDFDTYLLLMQRVAGEMVTVTEDDDGGDGYDSRLSNYTLEEDGEYAIYASSYDADEGGAYQIRFDSDGVVEPGETYAATDASAPLEGTLRLGSTSEGTLTFGDARLRGDSAFHDRWRFDGQAGQEVTIDMRSSAVDSYLMLMREESGRLTTVAEDDDGGDGYDARIGTTLEESGPYVVIAQGYSEDENGPYTLSLTEGLVETYAAEDADAPVEGAISYGETAQGSLSENDARLDGDDALHDRWRFQAEEGQQITIDLRSEDFDSYLMLMREESGRLVTVAENDDDGESYDARLSERLTEAGRYVIIASSYSSSARGSYRLTLETSGVVEMGAEYLAEDANAPIEGTLNLGRQVRGELTYDDARLTNDGSLHDRWIFEGHEGQWINVDMRSEDFDSYLILMRRQSDGNGLVRVGSDDDGAGGYDARLYQQLPAGGTYVIIANSFDPGEAGTYTLLLSESLPQAPTEREK